MSQMFAVAKLAGMACKVKPKRTRQRETELGGSDTHNLRWRAGIGSKHADLNYSNRPVRTRMPGGVGGVGQPAGRPYPDCVLNVRSCGKHDIQGMGVERQEISNSDIPYKAL